MNEEFIPFELAKKLQEKGFDWQTFDRYDHLGNFNRGFIPHTLRGCPMRREYYAPTIGLAMKWLREEKIISVEPYSSASCWRVTICRAYHQDRTDVGGGTCLKSEVEGYNDGGGFEKYEEAALAGIEYVIYNLI